MKRRDTKKLVLEALGRQNNQTIADLEVCTKLSKEGVRRALLSLMAAGGVHRLKEVRKFAFYESHVYALGPGDDEHVEEEPMIPVRERAKAIQETNRTVDGLRGSYQPGRFDPFRVLRAQVAV